MATMIGNDAVQRREQQYHARHAAEARRILEALDGAGKKLRSSDRQKCIDYSREVLGDEKFAPWLMVYSAVSGEFKEGWIPDNFYGARVIPVIQGRHGRTVSLKSLARAFLGSGSLPDIGSQINGALVDRDYRPIAFDDARARFFQESDRLVFKADGSFRGQGVHFFDQSSFDESAIRRLGNGVFQRRVGQHGVFDRFSRTAVATVRLTTAVEDGGEIRARAAYLRLGTGADTHVRSNSHVRVALDVGTGALSEAAFLANWHESRVHPTSGEPFAGAAVPAFAQCLRTAVSLHERVAFVRCIGWDLAVDGDEKVHVLELNGFHNDIKFSEATQGPCFKGLGWEALA